MKIKTITLPIEPKNKRQYTILLYRLLKIGRLFGWNRDELVLFVLNTIYGTKPIEVKTINWLAGLPKEANNGK